MDVGIYKISYVLYNEKEEGMIYHTITYYKIIILFYRLRFCAKKERSKTKAHMSKQKTLCNINIITCNILAFYFFYRVRKLHLNTG